MGFRDECGVVGIFCSEKKSNANDAARLAYFALTSLQHRGQESAGIAVSDGEKIKLHKSMGLVSDVFRPEHFENLRGSVALAHVRYATAGGRSLENAQPFLNTYKLGSIALCHNGQLVNYNELREMLEDYGCTFSSTSDSEVILKLIVRKFIEQGGKPGSHNELNFSDGEENRVRFENAVRETCSIIKGSFALCIMTEDMLLGVRDPNGIRPLCVGTLEDDSSFIIASESCAIDAVNGTLLRDVAPGEMVIINKEGFRSRVPEGGTVKCMQNKQTCIFEYVYFARPDSVIDGMAVQEARYRMGEQLAEEAPVAADVVVGVPDSGIGAALGYAKKSGIPFVTGIIKNKYIGRTFIAPTQKERESMVFVKLNAIKSDLNKKRVIVIDDSIVRGTTSRHLVQMLRRAGASEVHFRVSSPPVKFPCHLGIDTPSKNELISSTHELEEIKKEIGADSLAFISLEGMLNALGSGHFCKGCFNGAYPV